MHYFFTVLSVCLLTCTTLFAQSTESRSVDQFTGISVSGNMETTVRQGPQRVEITADRATLERIETRVKNGRLYIEMRNENWGGKKYKKSSAAKITITVPRLDYIGYNGSGSLTTTDRFAAETLEIEFNGSGKLTADVEARELSVGQNGSGHLRISGETQRLQVKKNGSGSLDAPQLSANTVKVNSNGSGNTRLHAARELHVEANGSGNVHYSGNPSIRTDINGSGSVRQERNE